MNSLLVDICRSSVDTHHFPYRITRDSKSARPRTAVVAREAILRLREHIVTTDTPAPDDPEARLNAVRAAIAEIETAIERQVLVFEMYDDPEHAVVSAAERRIEKLAAEKQAREAERKRIGSERPPAPPVDLAAILETLPDLRPALRR